MRVVFPPYRMVSLILPVCAMVAVVAASNYLVQFPFEPLGLANYLTWGAFTYPAAFLVTDLTNRWLGPSAARRVVIVGFFIAVIVSVVVASPRIALASGAAFLTAQLLDVSVFDRLRQAAWWHAPLISSLLGSAVDTTLFFSLAFWGDVTDVATYSLFGASVSAPVWVGWAVCDFLVKVFCAGAMLLPYGAFARGDAAARGV